MSTLAEIEEAVNMPPRPQEEMEDYHAPKALRKAKADPKNQRRRPFAEVAKEIGLVRR